MQQFKSLGTSRTFALVECCDISQWLSSLANGVSPIISGSKQYILPGFGNLEGFNLSKKPGRCRKTYQEALGSLFIIRTNKFCVLRFPRWTLETRVFEKIFRFPFFVFLLNLNLNLNLNSNHKHNLVLKKKYLCKTDLFGRMDVLKNSFRSLT